jgi:hypothetical protein
MLSHVDRYGHTIFNRIQVSTVVEELLAIQPYLDGTALGTARSLRLLIEVYVSVPHRYLWFIGD